MENDNGIMARLRKAREEELAKGQEDYIDSTSYAGGETGPAILQYLLDNSTENVKRQNQVLDTSVKQKMDRFDMARSAAQGPQLPASTPEEKELIENQMMAVANIKSVKPGPLDKIPDTFEELVAIGSPQAKDQLRNIAKAQQLKNRALDAADAAQKIKFDRIRKQISQK